jgi:hypothetical protein
MWSDAMRITSTTATRKHLTAAIVATLLALTLAMPSFADGDKKKKKKSDATSQQKVEPKVQIDTSKLVWPSPPSIPRVRYLNYFAGMKIDYTAQTKKKKQGWMDRLAGAKPESDTINSKNFPFQLLGPYGIAIDS